MAAWNAATPAEVPPQVIDEAWAWRLSCAA